MHFLKSIRHLHISHIYTLFASQNFALALFSISLRTAVIPRRSEKQSFCKILGGRGGGRGAKKVHYGRCASGVCKGLTVAFYDCVKVENTLWFCDLFIF